MIKYVMAGAAMLLPTATALADSATADVSIAVSGLRNMKGQVLLCLTANPKIWPDCSKDANAHKRTVTTSNAGSVTFSGVAPGTYAISLIHDENSNGKLDTRVMIPREGFGFSRNPTVMFGPPKFKSAQFSVGAEGASQSVKMKYMF